MRTDSQLQKDVLAELKWQPGIDHEKIGVAVNDGVVALSGIVGSYSEKLLAEQTARQVKGVRAIAEELVVHYPGDPKTSDAEVAKRVSDVIEWDPMIPGNRINLTVEHGVVRLRGDVDWHYQKDRAFKNAAKISGVTRVENWIAVKPKINAEAVEKRIEQAFERQADLEAEKIRVRADGGKVVLEGTVSSWGKRAIAEKAAWAAPGVAQLEDNLVVS